MQRGFGKWATMREVTRYLEDLYGASYGAGVMKVGEQLIVHFAMETVNDRFAPTKIGVLDKAVAFLAAAMMVPSLKPEHVEQEKENHRRRIASLVNDRGAYAFERCLQRMCEGEAYAIYELGWAEDLPGITVEELGRKHAETLARAPVELFVVGDVAPAAVADVFRKRLKLSRDGVADPGPSMVKPAPMQPREVVEKLAVEQGKLVIGARTSTTWADDDVLAMNFANGILGGFPHSKLFANVREKAGLAYSVHSSLDHAKGLMFITAGIDPGNYAKAVALIKEQLWNLQQGFISKDEMDKTRASLVSRVRVREDSPSAKIGVLHEQLTLGRARTPAEAVGAYEAMTRQNVARAASKIGLDTVYFLTP